MRRLLVLGLLLAFLPAARAAKAEFPVVQTARRTVTLEGLGTRTYWVGGEHQSGEVSVLKVPQDHAPDKIYYLPASFHPHDYFRAGIDTPVVVTGSVQVRDGKNYLFPYSAL